MVLSTENNYYTNIISPVMLFVTPISGLTVKICRFSLVPTIAYIHQNLFKYFIFNLNTAMIPHKTYIPHIPAFVYLVCFYSQSKLLSDHFHDIIFRPVLCSALFYFQCLYKFEQNVFQYISNISANFQKTILQSGIFTAIFQHLLYFLKKWIQCL